MLPPNLVDQRMVGGVLHCKYRMCMKDAPGYVNTGVPNDLDRRDCYQPLIESEFLGDEEPKNIVPINIGMRFRTWVCNNPLVGSVAPGATEINWDFGVGNGGTAAESCWRTLVNPPGNCDV